MPKLRLSRKDLNVPAWYDDSQGNLEGPSRFALCVDAFRIFLRKEKGIIWNEMLYFRILLLFYLTYRLLFRLVHSIYFLYSKRKIKCNFIIFMKKQKIINTSKLYGY